MENKLQRMLGYTPWNPRQSQANNSYSPAVQGPLSRYSKEQMDAKKMLAERAEQLKAMEHYNLQRNFQYDPPSSHLSPSRIYSPVVQPVMQPVMQPIFQQARLNQLPPLNNGYITDPRLPAPMSLEESRARRNAYYRK